MTDFFELRDKIKALRPVGIPYVQAASCNAAYNTYSASTATYGQAQMVADPRVAQDITALHTALVSAIAQQNAIIEFLKHQFDAQT